MTSAVAIVLLGLTGCSEQQKPKSPPPSLIHADLERRQFSDSHWVKGVFLELRDSLTNSAQLDSKPLVPADAKEVAIVCAVESTTKEQRCALGKGLDLGEAVDNAAIGLRRFTSFLTGDFVLTLDVVTNQREERLHVLNTGGGKRNLGLQGYVTEWNGASSFVLPSDVLRLGMVRDAGPIGGIPAKLLIQQFIANNEAVRGISLGAPIKAVRTAKWVEGGSSDLVAQRIYRLHPYEQIRIEPEALLKRIVWAADHLVRTVSPEGRVRYRYDPRTGEEGKGYNLLRHAGTTYSLIQAYQRVGDPTYLEAAERAISYLMKHTKRDERKGPYGGGDVLYVVEGDAIKLGGAGLALLMLVEYIEATGSRELLADAQAFARFIVAMQRDSGEFIYFAPLDPKGTPGSEDSAYYPGEAILGLVRLYALDGDKRWLETASRGADWLIQVRDAGKDSETLANDHWLMIALSYLIRETKDDRYLEHSIALARAVVVQQKRTSVHASSYVDYRGGYYDPPRSTPAATRAEGLVAVLDSCDLAGLDCAWVKTILLSTEAHALQSQYIPSSIWWVSDPMSVVGGFAGGVMDLELRNDFTQHNLSAMMGTERHLRSLELPGGPGRRLEEGDQSDVYPVGEVLDAFRNMSR